MDYYLFEKINNLAGQWPWLDATGIFLAEYLPYGLVALALLLFWKKWKVLFQAFLAGVTAKFVIAALIHCIWERSRPFVDHDINLLIAKLDEPSFPSGHTVLFFALSTVVYAYNKKAGIGFFIASFLMAVSRIFVGVHWPADILAGILVGVFSGWLVIKISQKAKTRFSGLLFRKA